ncbi:MAG: TonB-dependent receptor [Flammeovirgaceae bacterium]|nr:TonB-dependent receptor [Flammeovirgaceae bacterium]
MNRLLLLSFFLPISLSSFGQEKLIHGTITSSEDKSALPGVTVVVKGTSKGTVTDLNGNYKIQVVGQENVLLFSSIGFISQEVTINNKEQINIVLEVDTKELAEVVVTGYRTGDKRLLTEAVGVVKTDAIKDFPIATIDGALQGQTTGVQVIQNSGTPGGGMSVRIRGTTSISGSGQPLYVIDGIPVTTGDYAQVGYEGQGINSLSDLNPNEIESFSILKDAAAAAIYGARGSNGVVLITTKRGKSGASVISFNTYYGVQQTWKQLDMLNTHQWMAYRNDLTNSTIFTEADMAKDTTNTNWQDAIFRTAPISSYDLSVNGGDEKTKFFASGSYFRQKGIVIGSDYQRANARINVDHKVNSKLNLGTSIGLTYSKTDRIEGDQSLHGPLPNGISTPNIYPVYNSDGSYNQDGPYSNAVSIANEATNENFTYRTLGNVFAEYQIIPGLSIASKWAVDFYNLREHAFEYNTVQGAKYNGLGFETYTNVLNLVSNNILKYEKVFNDNNFDFLIGYSFEKKQTRNIYIRGQDYASADLEYLNSASTFVDPSAGALDQGIRSFFGKANYNYANKYLIGFSARMDASTNFGSNNKNGFFPSASAAWRLSEEDFIKNNMPGITQLKLRASYGLLGNDNIPPFQYAALYGTGTYNSSPAIYPNNMPNPNLKWETTAQADIGVDISLHDRFTIGVDLYNKLTKDLLLSRPLPPTTGFSSIVENIGEMENKGIEVSLGVQQNFGPVEWTSNLNVSVNRNKVLKLYNDQPIDDLGRGSNRVMVGQPIGIFYSYESLGVNPSTGDIVYLDKNFDKSITTDDRTIIGNPQPKFVGGFTNGFSYKSFDLNVFFQFSYGNDVFNGSRLYLESLQGGDNQTTAVLRRWMQPGDITDIPRATNDAVKAGENKRVSSRFIEDGSYLRLKNIALGYNVSKELISKLHLNSLRFYVSAQNLLTFTNYSGLDPEVNYSGNSTQVVGTDFFTFPQARTITLGANLKF